MLKLKIAAGKFFDQRAVPEINSFKLTLKIMIPDTVWVRIKYRFNYKINHFYLHLQQNRPPSRFKDVV